MVLAARGGKVAPADGEKLKKIASCSFSVLKCDAAELADTARMVGAVLAKGSPLAALLNFCLIRKKRRASRDTACLRGSQTPRHR